MSADNYIGVLPGTYKVGEMQYERWGVIPYGCMSILYEDCQYRGQVDFWYDSRADALVAAHSLCKGEVVEYGVIELDPVPDAPCGTCYVCVHDRIR